MTNAQILTAVLLKWSEPVLPTIANTTIDGLSKNLFPIERFLKNWGIASENWSINNEIQSIVSAGGARVVRPFLENYISKIPDAMIPEIIHGYVDGAIQQGGLTIFDKFTFEKADLEELKKYLDCNLPLQKKESYNVIIPTNENQNKDNTEAQTV